MIVGNTTFASGIKVSDTGLCHPSMWDFAADKAAVQEQALRVVRVLSIIKGPTEDNPRYMVQAKHGNKFVTELDKELSPPDVREGIRVG